MEGSVGEAMGGGCPTAFCKGEVKPVSRKYPASSATGFEYRWPNNVARITSAARYESAWGERCP